MTLPDRDPSRALRIGNCSGFFGDRMAALREMVTGGPLDVVTGDYLAELTMLILFRTQAKDPTRGYAATFLRQLEDVLGEIADRGVRVVVNAGGLNPAGCADAVRVLATKLGVDVPVAHVEGDDVRGVEGIPPGSVTANAYLGGWPIAAALEGGAQIVVTGRCTDAALVGGPAAWWHGWAREDWDALAGAVVVGHVLECGTQATGGNYSFFQEVPGLEHPGFPLAEVEADGSAVITKHPGTGGLVSVGTVTAQLLYEIAEPHYAGPDVVADFASITLTDDGADRVRISGVRGAAPPSTLKVATNTLGGLRNAMTFVLTGLDIEEKAALVKRTLTPHLAGLREVTWNLARTDHEDADTEQAASAQLTVAVKDSDPNKVGRGFSSLAVEIALASYPGCTLTSPPGDGAPYGVYTPAYVDKRLVTATVVHADGRREEVPHTAPTGSSASMSLRASAGAAAGAGDSAPPVKARRVPLGTVAGARSGDKGGNANVGVWVRSDAAYAWLADHLDEDRVRTLLPETKDLPVTVHELPNLRAVNVVIEGILGEGVASSTRFDPQAKGLGEWLRSRIVDVPVHLLEG
ncbi:MAG TPA: acyclic terpene utilization AtuA family protein [Mycobacteriales bacterium]|nr:acyclic terpene utilization AtuA family protein [Mycobacteriales bacterium]